MSLLLTPTAAALKLYGGGNGMGYDLLRIDNVTQVVVGRGLGTYLPGHEGYLFSRVRAICRFAAKDHIFTLTQPEKPFMKAEPGFSLQRG